MKFEGLPPGVQHHQAADVRSQMPGRGGDLQQRLPYGAKQERIEPGRMGGRQRSQLVRNAEDHMEVLDGEQFPGALLKPGSALRPLTLGPVPVAPRVIYYG